MEDKKLVYLPESKIQGDKITIYGAGKFCESNLVIDKTRAAFLCIELLKFLDEDIKNKKTPVQQLEELTKDFYVLQENNLWGDKGDIIKFTREWPGWVEFQRADGLKTQPAACSLQYAIDRGTIKPLEIKII